MPGRLKARVVAGRHLPIMDRASDLTDAFVEVKFGSVTYKTEVFMKSLNPRWNSEWFKFEVDDEQLQDEPLQVRVLDHDTYSAHDAIGKVYIDIDPLLDPESSHMLNGWFPIYDTMHGIRGEIFLIVKLELFADINQFKQSSCGFKFICGIKVPECYRIKCIHGFVHDLLVNEDPEYQWIEMLRTPRASNEARQRLFSKMCGELQRRIGSKVESIGGNAVVGYQQSFDIEGDSGVVVRGIGTAVTIESEKSFRQTLSASTSPARNIRQNNHSVSTNSLSPDKPVCGLQNKATLDEFPFFTMDLFPAAMLNRLSVVVSAYSVKLLEKVHNQEEIETRDYWWDELRQEVKGHCQSLGCNAVIGYSEQTSICDEVIVLSAYGTAAVINPFSSLKDSINTEATSQYQEADASPLNSSNYELNQSEVTGKPCDRSGKYGSADIFRVPFVPTELLCPMKYQPSPLDPNITVPDILFSTIDMPPYIQCCGKGTLVQARFCRVKKKGQGETNAALVSDILPFIEYELHKRLYNKVKLHGMNALFGFNSSITLGENLVVRIATGTAVYLPALPPPEVKSMKDDSFLKQSGIVLECTNFTKKCKDTFDLNYKINKHLKVSNTALGADSSKFSQEHMTSTDKMPLFIGIEDMTDDDKEINSLLNDSFPPPLCYLSNLDLCPGIGSSTFLEQTFAILWRVRYNDDVDDRFLNDGLSKCFQQAFKAMWFRLRRKNPTCMITSLRFELALPDDDELQLWITGTALAHRDQNCCERPMLSFRNSAPVGVHLEALTLDSGNRSFPSSSHRNRSNEEDSSSLKIPADDRRSSTYSMSLIKPLSPIFRRLNRANTLGNRFRHSSSSSNRSRYYSEGGHSSFEPGFFDFRKAPDQVETTAMSFIPGRTIKRHIGIINMFIIRETSVVRGTDAVENEPYHGSSSSCFVMRSLAETQALIRAHVGALGGNALTSYRLSYSVLKESLTKNEAQCLFHASGDVVTAL